MIMFKVCVGAMYCEFFSCWLIVLDWKCHVPTKTLFDVVLEAYLFTNDISQQFSKQDLTRIIYSTKLFLGTFLSRQ